MNKREERVINAFITCVHQGQFTFECACLLIEDTQKYGYLSDTAKETFYAEFETPENESEEESENGSKEV